MEDRAYERSTGKYQTGREMRTVIRDTPSSWSTVTIGVTQGSVLLPIIFQIQISDIQENLNSYINLFADDAKLLRVIKNYDGCMELQ